MSPAVVQPHVPYQGEIPGGLQSGKIIEIRGSVHQEATWFAMNLCVGMGLQCDRALHVSVRLQGREVVLNSLEHGQYRAEQRGGPFPFMYGHQFTVMIGVEPTCYKISVDGEQCYTFNHRLPVESVRTLLVEGDVDLERIEFIETVRADDDEIMGPSL